MPDKSILWRATVYKLEDNCDALEYRTFVYKISAFDIGEASKIASCSGFNPKRMFISKSEVEKLKDIPDTKIERWEGLFSLKFQNYY